MSKPRQIPAQPSSWIEEAACRGVNDPEVFFPPNTPTTQAEAVAQRRTIREAKQICGECVSQEPCRTYALDNPTLQGIWGGTTEAERVRLRREISRHTKSQVNRVVPVVG